MPLERRVQKSRSNRRQCSSTRHQPYRLQTSLSGTRREVVTLGLNTSRRDAAVRVPFEQLAKRHGTYVCATYDEPMQTDDVRSETLLENEADETQRLYSEQRPQTNPNNGAWHSENSTLRSDLIHHLNRSSSSTERHVESIASAPPTTYPEMSVTSDMPSMIPNVVPMSSPSEISESIVFVTNSDRLPVDAIQSARIQSTATCCQQDLVNEDVSDQLSNHDISPDISLQEHTAPIQDDDSMSLSASFRMCRRSMSCMAPPSSHARHVANRVIRHARDNKTPDERVMWCPDCKQLPVLPVTGQCGHTRCTRCIQDKGSCPCGKPAPKTLHVNTLIQGLVRKIRPVESRLSDVRLSGAEETPCDRKSTQASLPVRSSRRHCGMRSSRVQTRPRGLTTSPEPPPQTPLSPQCRFELACRLVSAGRHWDAAPHLARVAARPNPLARVARALLAQIITVLSEGVDPRRLTRALYRAVRAQAARAWLAARDLECVLCYHVFTSPVSTPCGHSYCRTCIERSMDYRKSCALCLRPLDDFDLAATKETVFVCAALESIDALTPPAPPPDPDVIPIFVCTVAYPAIPCPLFIFDPRYWLMIRRVLESGSRTFGMVAYERDRSYSDYGTVLEVCDCVHLEDGRSILSTVGVSRFRVIDRDVRDGCDVARIQSLTDIAPTEELVIWELRIMATQISYKALLWLNGMSARVRSEIETAFGQLPRFDHARDWWDSPDGPAWLWWLIAILPLRSEIKILILSTKNLLKRMMAVSRTLDAIDQVAMSASSTECELSALSTAEDWLVRSA